jgi:hypothetical protein
MKRGNLSTTGWRDIFDLAQFRPSPCENTPAIRLIEINMPVQRKA